MANINVRFTKETGNYRISTSVVATWVAPVTVDETLTTVKKGLRSGALVKISSQDKTAILAAQTQLQLVYAGKVEERNGAYQNFID